MSAMHARQWAGRQQQVPTKKRRLVTYHMHPLSDQAGYTGPREDGHRFGVNRILRFGDDGLLSAGRDGTVRRWDVASFLLGGGSAPGWRTEEGSEMGDDDVEHQPLCTGIFRSHTDWVTGLAVAEGRIMASSSNDGTLKLWDLAAADRPVVGTGRAGMPDDGRGRLAGLGERLGQWDAVQSSGLWKSVGLGNFIACSQDKRTGVGTGTTPAPSRPDPIATVAGHGDYVKCLAYAPERAVLVSGGLDKRIVLWDLQRMAAPLMTLLSADGEVRTDTIVGGISRGRPWVGEGPWFHIRDPSRVILRPGAAATGPSEVLELSKQNKGSVYCVDASVEAALVASGGTDRMIRLLDPRAGSGQAAMVCKLDGHRDNVRCVRIDEGGTRVVSGSTDGTLRVWDVRQQCCLGVYEVPGGSIWAMQPSPCDFHTYYSGGRGRRVYRTNFATGESVLVCLTSSEVLDIALEPSRGSIGREQGMSMWLSSTAPDISLWGGHTGGGVALRTGCPGGKEPDACLPARGGHGGKADLDCLLTGPREVIHGQPGIVRHVALNNRRHVLTEDDASPPNVALWDVTKAKQVEAYPRGTLLEDKERALHEIISVRPWFTIDTHLGTPLVSLSESTVFDGELYAVDARGERQTFLSSPPSIAPSSQGDPALRDAQASDGAKAAGGGRAGPTGKTRFTQEEVKVNLGEAVLRGLFSKWIDQHHRLDGARADSYRRSNGTRAGGRGQGDGGCAYSSDESESDGSDTEQESEYDGSTSESRASGESGSATNGNPLLDAELAGSVNSHGGVRSIGDDAVLWVTETDLGGNGGMQRTLLRKRVDAFDGTEGEDIIPHWVKSCVVRGDFHVKEQPKVAFYLAPWVPPDQLAPRCTPSSQEQEQQQQKRIADYVSQRYTAPAQMLVCKVMAYVLSHDDLRQYLETPGLDKQARKAGRAGEGEGAAAWEQPEDLVEVLCGDRVLQPHLYIDFICLSFVGRFGSSDDFHVDDVAKLPPVSLDQRVENFVCWRGVLAPRCSPSLPKDEATICVVYTTAPALALALQVCRGTAESGTVQKVSYDLYAAWVRAISRRSQL